MTTKLTDIERALFEWLDNNFTSVVQAFEMAADRNREDADGADRDHLRAVAKALRESAQAWERRAAELRDLYQQLPCDED